MLRCLEWARGKPAGRREEESLDFSPDTAATSCNHSYRFLRKQMRSSSASLFPISGCCRCYIASAAIFDVYHDYCEIVSTDSNPWYSN